MSFEGAKYESRKMVESMEFEVVLPTKVKCVKRKKNILTKNQR